MSTSKRRRNLIVALVLVVVVGAAGLFVWLRTRNTTVTTQLLHQDVIINADLWSAEPQILSAGYGFDGIIGVDGDEAEVRAAGGTWNTATCSNNEEPPRNVLTSSATTNAVVNSFDASASFADGLPVVFSYPILPSTLDHTDFLVTLNTGETLTPDAATIFPNFEYNERHVAVIAGDFGNRLLSIQSGRSTRLKLYPDKSSTIVPTMEQELLQHPSKI